ncbi:MAG: LpxL/LpxP family acyltransferase [Gammaproteobacteria bacterium]
MKGTHWADLGEYSLIWGMRLLLGVYRYGGRRLVQYCLYPVVAYYWLAGRQGRDASRDYLRRVSRFAPDSGLLGGRADSFRHFMAFAEAILDKLAAWAGMISLDQVEYRGREPLLDCLSRGQGVLLLGSHLGNLEVCRVIANLERNLRVTVLVHTRHAEKFNELLSRYNPASRLDLIQVSEITAATSMMLADKIEQGEIVIVAADRTPVNNRSRCSEVEFFGAKALFPQGPLILAALLKCPVLTVFCLKQHGRFVIYFDPFSEGLKFARKQREQALQEAIQRYACILQRYCLAEPLQWFNFYPFWHSDS